MTDKTMVKVLPRMVEEWIGMEDICFITGKIIGKNDRARWTDEFDGWISERGQEIVEADARGPAPDPESLIIFAEWYAKDEANADAGYTAHLDESTTVKLVEVKRQLDVARLNDAIKICIERVHSAQRRWNVS